MTCMIITLLHLKASKIVDVLCEHTYLEFQPKVGGSMFPWNVGIQWEDYTVYQSKRALLKRRNNLLIQLYRTKVQM